MDKHVMHVKNACCHRADIFQLTQTCFHLISRYKYTRTPRFSQPLYINISDFPDFHKYYIVVYTMKMRIRSVRAKSIFVNKMMYGAF